MLQPSFTRQFQRDLKLMQKRGKDMQKFKEISTSLIDEMILEERYRNHKLKGDYEGRYECHIEPDWLLIYKLVKREIIFERTGTHSDLFG
jgi:mRNA interferase YafQ